MKERKGIQIFVKTQKHGQKIIILMDADSTSIWSYVHLLRDDDNYQLFKLKNQEFTFTTEASNLSC
jgi:hypothetical protein